MQKDLIKKKEFPIFKHYPDLIYLDNASTTQTPNQVINTIEKYYKEYNANVGRGLYPTAVKTTEYVESVRMKIAKFINASPEEIIFTSGVTASLNGIARALYKSGFISENPRIVLSDIEHHANLLPWMELQPEIIQYISLSDESYVFDEQKLPSNVDVIALSAASNVTGTILDTKKYIKKNNKAFSIVDASQISAHRPIDVKDLNCDFLVFSGHKMYGPTGIGIMYIKKNILEELEPWDVGGGMIQNVTRNTAEWSKGVSKFEAGTPNIAGIFGIGAAIDFINSTDIEKIIDQEQELRAYARKKLHRINNVEIFHPDTQSKALGVISFTHEKVHAHDIADFLGDRNICVRAGHHCAQILHQEVFKVPASVRISFGVYNSTNEIDMFINALQEAIEFYT